MRYKNRIVFFLGYNAPSESQESKAPANKDPTTWSVDDVVWFIRDADPQALGPHADIFRKHVSVVFRSDQPLWSQMPLQNFFLHLLGDWWKCSPAPEEWHDHEVPGTQAGAGPEALLPHWQTKAEQILKNLEKCIWNLEVAIELEEQASLPSGPPAYTPITGLSNRHYVKGHLAPSFIYRITS